MFKNITIWLPSKEKHYFEVGKECYGNLVEKIFSVEGTNKIVIVSKDETLEYVGCEYLASKSR